MLKPLELAIAELGYLEKKSNANLDSKTANAGSNNYTKYARDLDAVSYFNGKKQGYAWCATFFNWLFFKCYGRDTALRMLYEPLTSSMAASCTQAVKYYEAKGKLFKTPQVGDQVFFRSGSTICHTGIVEKAEDGRVYTIEGNTSATSGVVSNGGGVWRKNYPSDYSRIYGYGRPDWSLVRSEADEAVEWITKSGIMLGDKNGDLHLDATLTRRQFAVMLYRYDQQK